MLATGHLLAETTIRHLRHKHIGRYLAEDAACHLNGGSVSNNDVAVQDPLAEACGLGGCEEPWKMLVIGSFGNREWFDRVCSDHFERCYSGTEHNVSQTEPHR